MKLKFKKPKVIKDDLDKNAQELLEDSSNEKFLTNDRLKIEKINATIKEEIKPKEIEKIKKEEKIIKTKEEKKDEKIKTKGDIFIDFENVELSTRKCPKCNSKLKRKRVITDFGGWSQKFKCKNKECQFEKEVFFEA